MKQTAVEWLINNLPAEMVFSRKEIIDIFAKAKQMEKEQINKAYYDGYYQEELYDAREYYNDTYTNNKQQ